MTTPPSDTADLRSGPHLHDALLALLPLVGTWEGTGHGVAPNGERFDYAQRLSFVHDGRPFLAYRSSAWLVDSSGAFVRSAWRESGFWRPGAQPDDVEVVLASNTGEAMLYAGIGGDQRWDISLTSVLHAPTAKQVDAERRLYAATPQTLVYASELAPAGRPLAPHLSASLHRTPLRDG